MHLAYFHFQSLIGTITLRRTKDTCCDGQRLVALPPKIVETCFVELSAEERECYDEMESQAQSIIRRYIDAGTVLHHYSTVLYCILRLRQICNDVALCPSDIASLLPTSALEGNVLILFSKLLYESLPLQMLFCFLLLQHFKS